MTKVKWTVLEVNGAMIPGRSTELKRRDVSKVPLLGTRQDLFGLTHVDSL